MKIAYLTGTRADFGLMARILKKIHSHPSFDLKVLTTYQHYVKSRGNTVHEVKRSGLNVSELPLATRLLYEGVPTILIFQDLVRRLNLWFSRNKTDLVLILGDRLEQFAMATVAHELETPILHLHGGENSGTHDDMYRRLIERMANVHAPATKDAALRLAKMGEERWRIHVVGAPGLEDAVDADLQKANEFLKGVQLNPALPFVLVMVHPESRNVISSKKQIQTLLSACARMESQMLFFAPNVDPSSGTILKEIARFCSRRPHSVFIPHVTRDVFLSLLKAAHLLIGNSSSGIIEAPFLGTPVLDLGSRQNNRFRSKAVRHLEWDAAVIANEMQKLLKKGAKLRIDAKQRNLYGDGRTSQRVLSLIENVFWKEKKVMEKCLTY